MIATATPRFSTMPVRLEHFATSVVCTNGTKLNIASACLVSTSGFDVVMASDSDVYTHIFVDGLSNGVIGDEIRRTVLPETKMAAVKTWAIKY